MTGDPKPPVTVVIPAYRSVDDLRRCVGSVLEHRPAAAIRLFLVDDASPEDEIGAYIDEVAAQAPVPVVAVHHAANQGFVVSANEGLRAAEGHAVVLNADTQVTAGWLDRMLELIGARDDVATVTPLTNSGSICTVPPAVRRAFKLDGGPTGTDDCASMVLAASLALAPEVITGVGFCMLVTRTALDLCGLFDAATFGRGYGEEVDFCLRATQLGLRHLVDDRTFVYHRGGGSFGDERTAAMAQASTTLHERYPWFRDANRAERRRDPLAVPFRALEQAVADRSAAADRPRVLHLLQAPSPHGGTEKHAESLRVALADQFDFSFLFPVAGGFVVRSWTGSGGDEGYDDLFLPGGAGSPGELDDELAAEALRVALDLEDVRAVHIHNLIGHSLAPLAVLAGAPVTVVCTIHDPYLTCPNHWLLYRNGPSCGLPEDRSYCARCLPETRGLPIEHLDEFRAAVAARLDTVDHWVAPSQSALDTLVRVYEVDPTRLSVIAHGAVIDAGRRRTPDEAALLSEPLRVGFVGRGWHKKGLDVVNALVDSLAGSTIEVHHFGEAKEPTADGLVLHGAYDNERLPDLLADAGIGVVLLPAPYAETFGLVMTEALVAGLGVIGTRYGALGERIRAGGVGWTVDPEDVDEVRMLIENLDACRWELLRVTRRVAAADLTTMAAAAPRYADLYLGRMSAGGA